MLKSENTDNDSRLDSVNNSLKALQSDIGQRKAPNPTHQGILDSMNREMAALLKKADQIGAD